MHRMCMYIHTYTFYCAHLTKVFNKYHDISLTGRQVFITFDENTFPTQRRSLGIVDRTQFRI